INQELTVVFPNKRAAYYLRNEFKKSSQQTLWLTKLFSIEEAVTQWSGIALADNIDLLFELIDIDAQLHREQNSDLKVFGSQATQMAKDFDEIDKYGIDARQLFSFVLDNKKLEIWDFDEEKSKEKELKYLQFFSSLHSYYLQLRERLSKQGKGYYGMITRHLSELPETELLEIIGDRNIIFAGFNALTTTEERIIDTLIKNGKAEILFDYDGYYLDDLNNEAGLFARRYQSKHPGWLKNGICNHLRTEEKAIHVISTSGNALQTKALQVKLQEHHNTNQAVVLADENLLIPVLNSIPGHYTGFNVSMGYPVSKTSVNQLVKELFSLYRRSRITRRITENGGERLAEGWYIWPVLHLMDLEIVKIIFPKEEISAFSRWKYEAVNSGKFIFEDKDLVELRQIPDIQSFLTLLLSNDDEKTPTTLLQSISEMLSFVAKLIQNREIKDETVFLLNQVSEIGKIVSRLQKIVEQNTLYINDLQSVETLFRVLASGARLQLDSSDLADLQIMGLLETRNLSFDRLHLLSANEGVLPPDKSQSSFIPSYIRRAMGLPGYAESQAVVAYNFYHLLQSAKEIYLYYNNLGETSGGEASRFILQAKMELGKNTNITITEEAFQSIAQPAMEEKSLFARKTEKSLDRLHYLTERKGLSPSSLSTYLNCPLKYYFRYVVDIKDNGIEEDTGANVIGSIIHDTLEFLFDDYLPIEGCLQVIDKTLFDERIKPLWAQKLAQSIAKNTPNGFPDVGFN
ncbi:MAG: PD-(D/E)XK nuclease family protein, partial [Bacteroidales bacterium]|nr:PD-(D/E)XK nuclease family protein [Bacteroidales bacterium]